MKYKIYLFIMIIFSFFLVKAENEATIKNIKVNGVECTCSGYECSVEVDASSATITYDLNDEKATVDRLSGFKIDLLSQVTTVKIAVSNSENEEKIENTYMVNITKHEKKADFSLKSLTVNGEKIELLEDVVSFPFTSKYDATKITIEAETNDSNAKVIKEKEYAFDLDNSSLAIDFYVQAENGEKANYRIVVMRGVKPDTTLKSLTVDPGKIDFDEKIYEYAFSVDYGINEIKVEAVPANKEAKVEIVNEPLVVGENEIKVIVTNDNNKSEYKLLVTREENIDKSIANLKSIYIREYPKLDFKENVLDYVLNFSKIPEKLDIEATPKDENSDITISGNENLADGSKIVIKVSLKESNIEREYTLELREQQESHDNKNVILISIIGLSITIIILFILEIHGKKIEKRKYLNKIFELRRRKESKRKEEKKKKEKIKEEEIEII